MLALFAATAVGWPYDESFLQYNLNQNKTATNPADYWIDWPDHTYFPSPENWRFPVYTLFLDRFVNGDSTNDNINGTLFEHDLSSNQMRHGGDVAGLVDTLDYLQGMGIKVSLLGVFCPFRCRGQRVLTTIGHLPGRNRFNEPAMGLGRLLGFGYYALGSAFW